MPQPVRRIVTTNDSDGRSKVLIDGQASNTIGVLTELWITDRTPASNGGHFDNAAKSSIGSNRPAAARCFVISRSRQNL